MQRFSLLPIARLPHGNDMALPQGLTAMTFSYTTHSRLRRGSRSELSLMPHNRFHQGSGSGLLQVTLECVQRDVCYAQVNRRSLDPGCCTGLSGNAYQMQPAVHPGWKPVNPTRMETMRTIQPAAPGKPFMRYSLAIWEVPTCIPISCYGYESKTEYGLMGCIYWCRLQGGRMCVVFFIRSAGRDEIGSAGCTP